MISPTPRPKSKRARKPRSPAKPAATDAARSPESDRALVDGCLQGDPTSWSRLYDRCHPPLLLAIRVLLGKNGRHVDLVEEIAARVWYAVIVGESELLDRFDADRGCRLTTYLAGVARNEISNHFRSERRRMRREALAPSARSSVVHSVYNTSTGLDAMMSAFLTTLSPREREYCEHHLLRLPTDADEEFSDANRWQLQHRIRRKLWTFLSEESPA